MELGMGEILLILLVALLVYGGRLPEVAAAVGRSLAELKRGLRDTSDSLRSEFDTFSELDPRRAVRRAWQPPRLTETPRSNLHPALATSDPDPASETETPPVPGVEPADAAPVDVEPEKPNEQS